MGEYREDLDPFASAYLTPDRARTVDQKITQMLIKRIVPLLEGPDVLEMGYGDGEWTGRLIEKFGKSNLVDASPRLIERAKTLYGDQLAVYTSYFEEFSPPVRFDSIVCTYVLEHVVDPVRVLTRCRDWLKPGGLLFVAVPNAHSLHRHLGVAMGIQKNVYQLGDSDRAIGHRRVYDASILEAGFRKAGFRIETRLPMMCKPLPNSLLTHLSDAQLEGLFDLGNVMAWKHRAILAHFCRPVAQ